MTQQRKKLLSVDLYDSAQEKILSVDLYDSEQEKYCL